MMYGKYNVPFRREQEGIVMTLDRVAKTCSYSRTCREQTVEKTLVLSQGDIVVCPVEPVNTPKAITPYLLIAFDTPLVIEPKATTKSWHPPKQSSFLFPVCKL